MISLITGKPGSGKTYFLTWLAYKNYKNCKIYSNFYINLPNIIYFKSIKDLENAENGIILIDEAQIYLNSRKWDSLDEFFQYKLQQHRKDGLDIFASTQHEARLDTVFREIVSEFIIIRNIFKYLFIIQYFSPEYLKKDLLKVKPEKVNYLVFSKKIANLYDTFHKIDYNFTDDFIIKDTKVRICPKCGAKKYLF